MVTLIAGCATNAPSHRNSALTDVPGLKIVMDCAECQDRPEVSEQIREGYAAAAAKVGVLVLDASPATLTVDSYSRRSLAFLMIAGPLALAMSDEIKATVLVDQRRIPVAHSSLNPIPIGRTERLCRQLGALTFEAISKVLRAPSRR